MKLLIASTNKGKILEIENFFKTFHFDILTLADIDDSIEPIDEPYETEVLNAIHKAQYYGKQTGLLTISDDTGFYVDALGGWPGVHGARVEDTNNERARLVLEKMKDVPEGERGASFRGALVLYDPTNQETFVTQAMHSGIILSEQVKQKKNLFGYDPIFYVPEKKKTHSQMTPAEKNSISWRGKALERMKYYLEKIYGGVHIVVPLALIMNDEGKLLMALRNDPHRPEFHETWEFPGGSVEMGEDMKENLIRETKEEVGYDIEIVRLLQHIEVKQYSPYEGFSYQVYLVPYLCKVIGGDGQIEDQEVKEVRWFELDDVLNQKLMSRNDVLVKGVLPELKKC